jgi:hypothetical protein
MPDLLRSRCRGFFAAMIVGIFAFAGLTSSIFAQEELHFIKLKAEQLPKEWKLTNEFPIPERQVAQLKAKLSASVEKVLCQTVRVKGGGEIRVNYVLAPSDTDLKLIHQKLISMVGQNNVVVRRGSVIIEVIAEETRLKKAVVELLPLSYLQKRKLHAASAPSGWRLVRELFALRKELDDFSMRFGVTFDEIINQFFLVQDQQIRVNYLAATTEQDAEAAYQKLFDRVGGLNTVFRKRNVITEVIAENASMKEEAERILNREGEGR